MMLRLAPVTENALLLVTPSMIDSGDAAGILEICSREGEILVTLTFANPSALEPSDGKIEFAPIAPAMATASGRAETGRIRNSDGMLIAECDVGSRESGAMIRLNETELTVGTPVAIREFKLATS